MQTRETRGERVRSPFRNPVGAAQKVAPDRPSAAAMALSENTNDEPVMRSGSVCPFAFAAQTRGMPSATTSDPVATSSASDASRAAARATSMSTGMIDPPCPATQARRTTSITPASVSASNHRLPSWTLGPRHARPAPPRRSHSEVSSSFS